MPAVILSSLRALLGVVNKDRHSFQSFQKLSFQLSTRQISHSSNLYGGINSPLTDPENKGKRQEGTNFDTLGSWNNRINMGIDVETSIRKGKLIPKLDLSNVGTASLLGRRKVNEDRMLQAELSPGIELFGIFDGHGGHIASEYVEAHMSEHVQNQLDGGETDLSVILDKAFVECNRAFTRFLYRNYIGNDQALTCGTTCTLCIIRNGIELAVGHVGDSRATLCRSGKHLRLTQDHEPENSQEKERIESLGGLITWCSMGKPRVNGRLQMSRSIGDCDLKKYGVTAVPDTNQVEISHGSDAFLILTSDGIHHVLNSQEMVNIVCACKDPKEAAKFVTEQALLFGSEDNCSAMVIPFGAWGKYSNSSKTVNFNFSRNLNTGRYG